MTDILMEGPQWAKRYVNDYLQSDMPHRMIRYRNGIGVDDYTLPDPELYLTYEPIALDHWPTIITVVISTNSFERIKLGQTLDPTYRVSYSMRTYIWVKTEGSEEVTLMRDRLTTVVRSSLLDRPRLLSCENGITAEPYIDEGGLREEFSDLTLIKGDRVLAGAYIGYDLTLNETVHRQPISTLSSIQLDTSSL